MSLRTSTMVYKVIRRSPFFALALPMLVGLSGCSIFGGGKQEAVLSRQRAFFSSYEEVERAMKQAMTRYPQKVDNPDAGLYETDWIKGDLRFKSAHSEDRLSSGYRYRLILRLVRGKSEAKSAIKVIVTKQIVLQRDFFADEETQPSDGLEEMIILYRIQRELALEKAIRRAQEKSNRSTVEDELSND